MIDFCLLGTGGMMPLPNRFLTALIMRVEGSSVLIDCGEGTQVALHLSGFSTAHIDHILITHFHGDHVAGLPGLLLTIANNNRTEPLHIWGGKGLDRVVQGLMTICQSLPYEVVVHELPYKEGTSFQTGALMWHTCPVVHRVPCLAYSAYLPRVGRFDIERAQAAGIPVKYWNKLQKGESVRVDGNSYHPHDVLGEERKGLRLTYATDCRPSTILKKLAFQSDVLIAEGLYGDPLKKNDAKAKGHMVYTEAAQLARDAEVEELWLTHYSPAMMQPKEFLQVARDIFPNTHCGKDLKMKTLRFSED